MILVFVLPVIKYVLSEQTLKELCEFLFVSKKDPAKNGE